MPDLIAGESLPFGKVPLRTVQRVRLTQQASLAVDQVSPKYMELARAGKLYGANPGSAVGLANIAAIPTVAAKWGLYNGSQSKNLVVIKIAVACTTITAPVTFSIIAGLPATPQAAAETKYSGSLSLPINTGQVPAEGFITDTVTLAATPLWQTIATYEGNSGLLGAGAVAWVDGMYIIPPRYVLGIDVVGSAGTTPLFDADVIWAELEMDLN